LFGYFVFWEQVKTQMNKPTDFSAKV